jgi:AcrR family transcriptional regulator
MNAGSDPVAQPGPKPAPSRSPAGDAARDRICEGAARAVVKLGAGVPMAEIAAECGTSKALLHYHYEDRARLLAEVTLRLARQVVSRERTAIGAAPAGTTLDALWQWLAAELQHGELRALLELAMLRDPAVRAASVQVAGARRASASATTALLFGQLGITPRMPVALLAEASVAFMDGLALDAGSSRDARVSFDIFWLALLGLAE